MTGRMECALNYVSAATGRGGGSALHAPPPWIYHCGFTVCADYAQMDNGTTPFSAQLKYSLVGCAHVTWRAALFTLETYDKKEMIA